MRSPVPRGEQPITHQQELEARIQALEAIVGALLRFSAGQQNLATALKEARHRGEQFVQEPANNLPPAYVEFYRDSFHALAVSMIPLEGLASFQASLQNVPAKVDGGGEEGYLDSLAS